MANSIELRVPLLDHVLLEFAASLPENLKLRLFTSKYIVKTALKDRIPREILTRSKAGFPVPWEAGLRTELRDWVSGILLDHETLSRGYFNPVAVEKLVEANARSGGFSKEILSLVSLELWHRTFLRPPAELLASTSDEPHLVPQA